MNIDSSWLVFSFQGIRFARKKMMILVGFQWYRVFHHEDNFDGLNIHSCLDLKKKPKLNHRWA